MHCKTMMHGCKIWLAHLSRAALEFTLHCLAKCKMQRSMTTHFHCTSKRTQPLWFCVWTVASAHTISTCHPTFMASPAAMRSKMSNASNLTLWIRLVRQNQSLMRMASVPQAAASAPAPPRGASYQRGPLWMSQAGCWALEGPPPWVPWGRLAWMHVSWQSSALALCLPGLVVLA